METSPKTNKKLILALLGLSIAIVFAAYFIDSARRYNARHMQIHGSLFSPARPVPGFRLHDTKGRPFGPSELRNHWSFLFFGYTRCPDICPSTLGILNGVNHRLGHHAHGHSKSVRFLFVSLDPEHDTPEVLTKYTRFFNSRFISLIGEPAVLQTFTKSLGIVYAQNITNPKAQAIAHSSTVLLINPHGELQAIFTQPFNSRNIAKDFVNIAQNYHYLR